MLLGVTGRDGARCMLLLLDIKEANSAGAAGCHIKEPCLLPAKKRVAIAATPYEQYAIFVLENFLRILKLNDSPNYEWLDLF